MNNTLKRILSVLAGIVTGALIVSVVESLALRLHPLPKSIDPNNIEAMIQHVQNAPFIAMFVIVLGYALAGFAAGAVSTYIAKDNNRRYAFICSILFFLLTLYNLIIIPSPMWFWILSLAVWYPCAMLGYRLVANKFLANATK